MGTLREAARDRDWRGESTFAAALTQVVGLRRARGAPPRVEPLRSYGDSARGRPRSRLARGGRVNPSCCPYARARRAATGRAACELWGLCARPLAIEIGEGGLVSLAPARLGRVSSYELSRFAAALTQVGALTRARGARPGVEPTVSYGDSARGRSRSRLARGAWSRWLQLGSVEFRVMNY